VNLGSLFSRLKKYTPSYFDMRRKDSKPGLPGMVGGRKRPPPEDFSGEHWRYCPQCGHELINEKCKLRCPRCHYFMSCSDFDFAG
jgi:hypothetical protein